MVQITSGYGAIPEGGPAKVRIRTSVLSLCCLCPRWPFFGPLMRMHAKLQRSAACASARRESDLMGGVQRGRSQSALFSGVAFLSALVAVGIVAFAAQVLPSLVASPCRTSRGLKTTWATPQRPRQLLYSSAQRWSAVSILARVPNRLRISLYTATGFGNTVCLPARGTGWGCDSRGVQAATLLRQGRPDALR